MPIALRTLTVREEALGDDQMEVVLGSRHGDVKQAAFLLELGGCTSAQIRRHAAIDDV